MLSTNVSVPAALTYISKHTAAATEADKAAQFSNPKSWEHLNARISGTYERLVAANRLDAAEKFLQDSHAILIQADYVAPSRRVLGLTIDFANNFDRPAAFDAVVPYAFARRVDFDSITDASALIAFGTIEIEGLSQLRNWWLSEPTHTDKVTDIVAQVLSRTSLEWRTANSKDLWKMHLSASTLAETLATQYDRMSSSVRNLIAALRSLTGYIEILAAPIVDINEQSDARLLALAYSPSVALSWYLEKDIPVLAGQISTAVSDSELGAIQKIGREVVTVLSQLMARLEDHTIVSTTFQEALRFWRECWQEWLHANSPHKDEMLSEHARDTIALCDSLSFAFRASTDSQQLVRCAHQTGSFLQTDATKEAKAAASAIAPIWMVAGHLLEKASEIEASEDLSLQALSMYLESGRLLTLNRYAQIDTIADCRNRLDRLYMIRPLQPLELGIVHLCRGYTSLKEGKLKNAQAALVAGAESMLIAMRDPNIVGFKNLIYQVGKIYSHAAVAARDDGDHIRSTELFLTAANTLEECAPSLKVEIARAHVIRTAGKYRLEAAGNAT